MRKIKQTVRTILLCGFLFAYTDATFAQITLSVKQQPVREVIKDVRRSLYKLRPGALDQRTLKDGLIKMIEEFQSVSHLNVDLYYEWENVDFENTKEDIILELFKKR